MSSYYITSKRDGFGQYLNEIGMYPTLTKEQEQEYGKKIQKMMLFNKLLESIPLDSAVQLKAQACACSVQEFNLVYRHGAISRDRMLKHNLKLVVHIARRYNNRGVDLEDLVQEGSVGLMRAVEKFNPDLGFKFSTYAGWWIKQSIIRAIANTCRSIRLPVHIHDLLNKIRRVERDFFQQTGRTPKLSEVADIIGVPAGKISRVQQHSKNVWSLDIESYDSDDSPSIEESFVNTVATQQAEYLFDIQHLTESMLQELDELELAVMVRRYGLNTGINLSYQSIADELGLNTQTVRKISLGAFEKLKNHVVQSGISMF